MISNTLEKWEEKTLGEVCEIISGTTPDTSNDEFWGKGNYWITPAEINENSLYINSTARTITDKAVEYCSLRRMPRGTVLFSSRAPIGKIAISNVDSLYCNQGFKNFICSKNIHNKFLYYFLLKSRKYLISLGKGATFKEVSKSIISTVNIQYPPLPEQERIVAKLDKSFEAIDKVKANAEQNLNNAKELFDGYLENIVAPKDKLGKYIKITTGKLNSNAAIENGQYPFFTCSRTPLRINNYSFDCEAILLAGNNASGDFNVKHYKGKFNAYQRTYVITIQDKSKLNYRYLYFQLFKALAELKKMSLGANTKFLRVGMITDFMLSMPTIEEQQKIVEKLDALQEQTKQLEAIYTQKIKECDELKQSILQKAFRGEL